MRITAFEMRAVGQPLERVERDLRDPADHEVVVEVVGCGVCHTDLGFLFDGVPTRHPLPLVLGHEVAGRVVRTGATANARVGDAVIVPAVIPCNRCELCARGRGDLCKKQIFPGNDDHGGFASHLVVPAEGLCRVDTASDNGRRLAKLAVCADAVSTAFAAVKKSELRVGGFAIVVGAGGVGGFAAQVASARGGTVLALDVDSKRLDRLGEYGVRHAMNVKGKSAKDVKKAVRELAKEHSIAPEEWRVFETSGTAAGQELAFALLGPGAYLGVVGFHGGDVTIRLSNLMAFAAKAEGTWGCPPAWFDDVLRLVDNGAIHVDPFVELLPMSSINDVLARMRRHEIERRPVLVPDFDA